jgi:hypothetical protein
MKPATPQMLVIRPAQADQYEVERPALATTEPT